MYLILVVFLLGAGLRWLSSVLIWRATRSKKSAEKRDPTSFATSCKKIDELVNDLSRYVGFFIGDIAKALFRLGFELILF